MKRVFIKMLVILLAFVLLFFSFNGLVLATEEVSEEQAKEKEETIMPQVNTVADEKNVSEIANGTSTESPGIATVADTADDIDWPDFSGAKFSLTITSLSVTLNLSNVSYSNEFKVLGGISSSATGTPDEFVAFGTTGENGISINKYYISNQDLYLTVKVTRGTEEKTVITGEKIERVNRSLGDRLEIMILNNKINITPNQYIGDGRTANLKIVKVTDSGILNSIKNKENNCLQKLYDYSKNATADYTFSGTTNSTGGFSIELPNTVNLTDKAYYALLIDFGDENGKYYPIEDILFAQALNYKGIVSLYTNIDWSGIQNGSSSNGSSSGKVDPDEEMPATLPKAGKISIGIFIVAGVVGSVVFYTKMKKYRGI